MRIDGGILKIASEFLYLGVVIKKRMKDVIKRFKIMLPKEEKFEVK